MLAVYASIDVHLISISVYNSSSERPTISTFESILAIRTIYNVSILYDIRDA